MFRAARAAFTTSGPVSRSATSPVRILSTQTFRVAGIRILATQTFRVVGAWILSTHALPLGSDVEKVQKMQFSKLENTFTWYHVFHDLLVAILRN